jgi:hypothetical protein
VLALAIALWRAVGRDSTTGMIGYYRRLVEDDRLGLPDPSVPIHEDAPMVTMRVPAGISTVFGRSGKCYQVGNSGVISVPEADAIPLRQAGWQELETEVFANA